MGPQLILRSSLFGRIGSTHLAQLNGDMFLACLSQESPAEDTLKCKCRIANLVSGLHSIEFLASNSLKLVQGGHYQQALDLMETVSPDTLRVLKHQQYWVYFTGMIKLRRNLHRYDITLVSLLSLKMT